MIYAQVLNGIVQNIIILNDESLIPLFLEGFQYIIRIDDINPIPGIGWFYDGVNFTAINS